MSKALVIGGKALKTACFWEVKRALSEAGDEEGDGQVVKPPVVTDPGGDRSGSGRRGGGALAGESETGGAAAPGQ